MRFYSRNYWGDVKSVNMTSIFGCSSRTGGRRTNQDRHQIKLLNLTVQEEENSDPLHQPVNRNTFFYAGVFDGHNGDIVSEYLANNLHKHLDGITYDNLNDRIYKAFEVIQDNLKSIDEKETIKAGSTAIIGLIGLNSNKLVIANAGDCQGVISHKGRAKALSDLHAVTNEKERIRVINDGGTISEDWYGSLRVNSSTEVTRSLGASQWLNKGVSSIPEITTYDLNNSDDNFLVLGSDGMFNNLSTRQAVVDIVKESKTPQEAADLLTRISTIQGYISDTDNATAIVVRLKGWGLHNEFNYSQDLKMRKLETIFGIPFEPDDVVRDLLEAKVDTMKILEYIYYDLFEAKNDALTIEGIQSGLAKMGKYIDNSNATISLAAEDTDGNKSISFEEFCKFTL